MNKLFGLVLLLAVAGGALTLYNAMIYEIVQPVPLGWNHSADEVRLLELERERRQLRARLGSGQRAISFGAPPQLGAADEDEKATLARLDEEIAALRAHIAATPR